METPPKNTASPTEPPTLGRRTRVYADDELPPRTNPRLTVTDNIDDIDDILSVPGSPKTFVYVDLTNSDEPLYRECHIGSHGELTLGMELLNVDEADQEQLQKALDFNALADDRSLFDDENANLEVSDTIQEAKDAPPMP